MNGSRSRTAQNTRSADGLILDPVVEKTLEHLTKRRDELRKQIAEHQEALKLANKELAKVDQAIVGLTALGRQTLLEKAGLALAFAGAGALAQLAPVGGDQPSSDVGIEHRRTAQPDT